MSVQVEMLEKSMAKITAEIPADEFDKAVEAAYKKNKNRFNIPGFRKGKAPRKVVEKMYGAGIFWNDALEATLPAAYEAAKKECGLDIVSDPAFDVESIENGKAVVYTAEVAVRPEVELGEYKGIEIAKSTVRVTKAEIQKELDQERAKNKTQVSVEREAQNGDIAVIDYEGFCDGEAFRGGKGENHNLTLGSGAFIPGFEEQVVGHKAGDAFDVNVTFPTPYHSKDLEGKDAIFKVTVKEVKEEVLPELDDEFASEVSEFDTLKDYEADIKKKLTMMKKAEIRQQQEDEAVKLVTENAKFELPAPMIETRAKDMLNQTAQRMQENGFTIEQYMQMLGMDINAMMDQMRTSAEQQLGARLVLCAIAKAEGIEATEEKFQEEIKEMAEAYDMEPEKLMQLMGDDAVAEMRRDLNVTAALNFVLDNAKEVAKKDKKADEKTEEAEEKPAKKPAAKKTTKKKADEAKTEE